MRRPVSGRDAVRSQVIDVLEAQIKRRPAMKKVSTAATKQSRNISQQKLTIGLDLGDRNSWYCVVDEAGQIQLDRKSTRLNSSHVEISYAVFCLKKKKSNYRVTVTLPG